MSNGVYQYSNLLNESNWFYWYKYLNSVLISQIVEFNVFFYLFNRTSFLTKQKIKDVLIIKIVKYDLVSPNLVLKK